MKPITLLAFLTLLISLPGVAEEVTVAVASNFVQPMKEIAAAFEQAREHQVRIVSGSSGKLFAQIQHGAPYQIFFSADESKPRALVEAGHAVSNSSFTYALGALALWSAQTGLVEGGETLKQGRFNKLAIANPKLAPYGVAAVQTLKNLHLWDSVRNKLVWGENIAQTFQFVSTGNAELGLVAVAQVKGAGGSAWRIPPDLYDPVRQDLVLLQAGARSVAAQEFLRFVRSEVAISIIEDHGYRALNNN